MDAEVSGARAVPRQAFATRIAMSDTENGELLMTIEASDRPGLLLAITRSLFRAGVQIVASEATTEGGRVVDRFTIVEIDGSPVSEKRRRSLQTDVLAAVDAVARGPSSRIDNCSDPAWGMLEGSMRLPSTTTRARRPVSCPAAARRLRPRGLPASDRGRVSEVVDFLCHVSHRLERATHLVRQPVGFEEEHVRGVLLMETRRPNRVRRVHPEVDRVRELLKDRRDDARSPGGTEHELDVARAVPPRSSATSTTAFACPVRWRSVRPGPDRTCSPFRAPSRSHPSRR